MALGDNTREMITFSLATLLLLPMVAWVVRALARFEGRQRARSAFTAARKALGAWRGTEKEDDVSTIASAKVEQQRLEQFRRTTACLCFAAAIFTVTIVANVAAGNQRQMTVTQDVAHLSLQGVGVAILLCPDLVTSKTIDAFYIFIALCFAVYVAPFACRPELMTQSITILDFCMAAMAVSRRSLSVTVPATLLYAISSSATIFIHGKFCVHRPVVLSTAHFVLVLGVPAACSLLETAMLTLLRQGLDMQNTKELLGAACALLRSVCDVVVELDASGVIIGSVDSLGSFLLKGPGFKHQSHRLADLLSNGEDKEMFERKLEESPSGTSLAEALHVRMKDGDRNLVRVEIFSFRYQHLDGQPRFMVGLREFADHASAGGRPVRVPEAAEEAPRPRPRLQQAASSAAAGDRPQPASEAAEESADGRLQRLVLEEDEEVADSSASSGRSTSSSAGRSARRAPEVVDTSDDPTPAVVTVDATAEGVPVRGLSAGFQMRIGRLAMETRLLELIEPGKAQDFAGWLRAAARYGSVWPPSRVTLILRQGRCKATITVLQEPLGGTSDPTRLQLLFTSVSIGRGPGNSCKAAKAYTDFRGTPRDRALHMTL